MMNDDIPQWERSPRRHGYWWGNRRIGYVGLTPPGNHLVLYTAYSDVTHETQQFSGLIKAKRFIEREWKRYCRQVDEDLGRGDT